MRTLITIKAESSNDGKVKFFWRDVRNDEHGEYVLHHGHRAYIKRDTIGCYVDHYREKPTQARA